MHGSSSEALAEGEIVLLEVRECGECTGGAHVKYDSNNTDPQQPPKR